MVSYYIPIREQIVWWQREITFNIGKFIPSLYMNIAFALLACTPLKEGDVLRKRSEREGKRHKLGGFGAAATVLSNSCIFAL